MHARLIGPVIAFYLLASQSLALAGELCGSKEGYFNQLATSYLIPDYYPPENGLSQLIKESERDRCLAIGSPHLGISCASHDRCYEAKLGKDYCDKRLQDEWLKECRVIYNKLSRDHLLCRLTCEVFVKILSEAQRYEQDDFCPSCTAYENAGITGL